MKKNITLKEIANELEVSVSTVSKALHDSKEISKETRSTIQAFAKALGYKRNKIALNLKNQKTNTIGIIIPQIVNQFFSQVVKGIELETSRRNYSVIITVSNDSYKKEMLNIQTLANERVDGFILSVAKETMFKENYNHFNEVIESEIPIVMFDREAQEVNCDKVIIDDTNACEQATQKLLDSGCKKIALISTEDFVSVGRLRKEGYIRALEKNNIPVNEDLIIKVDDILKAGELEGFIFQELTYIMQKHPDIDGLIGVNEFFTITAANYFKRHNLRIPEDVSIIAFSDGDTGKYYFPRITAISQNGILMGETAARLLIDKLEGKSSKKETHTHIINTELKLRESTKTSVKSPGF